MKEKNIYFAIACAILIIAGLYLRIPRGEYEISSSRPIADFPLEFSGFRGESIFSYNNYNTSADQSVQRIYKKEGVPARIEREPLLVAAPNDAIASRDACTWKPASVAPMSSRMLCSVREAMIGSARPWTKTR